MPPRPPNRAKEKAPAPFGWTQGRLRPTLRLARKPSTGLVFRVVKPYASARLRPINAEIAHAEGRTGNPMADRNRVPTAATHARKSSPRTLAIDVGGTGIKAITLDVKGKAITQRSRIATPRRPNPKAILDAIGRLASLQGRFDRVSVGFPGVVKRGVVYSAANLGKGWNNYPFEKALTKRLRRPVRLANDADVQGLGCVSGHGLELVITLGTGFGSVLFIDGRRIHLEIGHQPFRKGRTYEDELGDAALRKKGKRKWNKRLGEAIEDLKNNFNYDRLYIGGGNSKFINLKLPPNTRIVSNLEGLLGGIALWREPARAAAVPIPPRLS